MAADRSDLERLVREHGAGLLKTAVLLTGGRQEGEDLLQDALEVCFRRWPAQGVEFPAAYVRTVMIRLGQRRRPRWSWLRGEVALPNARAVDDMVVREDRHELLVALRRVPPRQRAAVVLRHWEGLSEAETAEALGCSVGTVKSQTARGLARLRDIYLAVPPEPHRLPAGRLTSRNGAPR